MIRKGSVVRHLPSRSLGVVTDRPGRSECLVRWLQGAFTGSTTVVRRADVEHVCSWSHWKRRGRPVVAEATTERVYAEIERMEAEGKMPNRKALLIRLGYEPKRTHHTVDRALRLLESQGRIVRAAIATRGRFRDA
jgi:hypothetical protein